VRFIEQYGDPLQYKLAAQQTYPATASTNQWHPWYDQVHPGDIEPALLQHHLRVGYWASVSYFDHHFGMMLDALEDVGVEQDTVVLMSGDVSQQHLHPPSLVTLKPSHLLPSLSLCSDALVGLWDQIYPPLRTSGCSMAGT
jgi:arylsulfatase A-like enzyme